MKANIRIGFAPTRRAIFSAPAAVEYRNRTAARLRELGIDFVDIDDVNEEGLLYDDAGLEKITETVIEHTGSKIDELVKDHTYRLYRCKDCDFKFWQYRFFWEKY